LGLGAAGHAGTKLMQKVFGDGTKKIKNLQRLAGLAQTQSRRHIDKE
jgi:hypothetical protein